jgi:uncharacterized protein YybS (DUF2232 family)
VTSTRARQPRIAAKPTGRIRTQGLTEGAILAALVAVLAVATRYLPPLALVTTYLCPLPFAMLVIRHGFKVAAIAGVVATLVGITLAGPLTGLLILVTFAPMGLVLGIGARQGWQPARVILLGTLVSSVSTAVSFMGLMGGPGFAATFKETSATMDRSIAMATEFYERFGMSKAQIDAMAGPMRELAKIFPYVLPGILVASAGMAAWLNYEVGRRVLKRFGYQLMALPPMGTWRVPYWVIWLWPLSSLLLLVSLQMGKPVLSETIGSSTQMLVMMVLAFNGLLAVWVILGNLELTKAERTIAMVFLVSMSTAVPLINYLAVLLGLLDSVLKVRDRWGLPRPAAPGARP